MVYVIFFIECFSLSQGNEKHDLNITPQQGCSEPTVRDLAQVVEEATGVPLPFQKLIFKGRHFSSSFEPLWLKGLFKTALHYLMVTLSFQFSLVCLFSEQQPCMCLGVPNRRDLEKKQSLIPSANIY